MDRSHRTKKSTVWEFFSKKEQREGETESCCKQHVTCHASLSLNKISVTTSRLAHLRSKHPRALAEAEGKHTANML